MTFTVTHQKTGIKLDSDDLERVRCIERCVEHGKDRNFILRCICHGGNVFHDCPWCIFKD